MYLYATYEGPQAHEFVTKPLPLGAEWPEVADQVERLEVWASNVDDSGPDRYELVAFDSQGHQIGRNTVLAY